MDRAVDKKRGIAIVPGSEQGLWTAAGRCSAPLYLALQGTAAAAPLKLAVLEGADEGSVVQERLTLLWRAEIAGGRPLLPWMLLLEDPRQQVAYPAQARARTREYGAWELLSLSCLVQWFADRCMEAVHGHPLTDSEAYRFDAKSKSLHHEAYQYDVVAAQRSLRDTIARGEACAIAGAEALQALTAGLNGQRAALVDLIKSLWVWQTTSQGYLSLQWTALLLLSLADDVARRSAGRGARLSLSWQQKAFILMFIAQLGALGVTVMPLRAEAHLCRPFLVGAALAGLLEESALSTAYEMIVAWPQLPATVAYYYSKQPDEGYFSRMEAAANGGRGPLARRLAMLMRLQRTVLEGALSLSKAVAGREVSLSFEDSLLLPPYYRLSGDKVVPIVRWSAAQDLLQASWYEKVPAALRSFFS